ELPEIVFWLQPSKAMPTLNPGPAVPLRDTIVLPVILFPVSGLATSVSSKWMPNRAKLLCPSLARVFPATSELVTAPAKWIAVALAGRAVIEFPSILALVAFAMTIPWALMIWLLRICTFDDVVAPSIWIAATV